MLSFQLSEECPHYQFYFSALKLTFHLQPYFVTTVIDPECPCESPVSIGKNVSFLESKLSGFFRLTLFGPLNASGKR